MAREVWPGALYQRVDGRQCREVNGLRAALGLHDRHGLCSLRCSFHAPNLVRLGHHLARGLERLREFRHSLHLLHEPDNHRRLLHFFLSAGNSCTKTRRAFAIFASRRF